MRLSFPSGLFVFVSAALLLASPARVRAYEGAVDRPEPKPEAPHVPVLTKAPELKTFVEAAYPPDAAKEALAGEVGLVIEIAADGTVADAQVIRPAGHGFDEAALAAVRQFVFSPAELDGAPASVRLEYVYKFELRAPPEPKAAEPPAAKRGLIEGRVLERGSRAPVAGASLACTENGAEAVTDVDGRFRLEPPVGPCTVQIRSYSHESWSRLETIAADQKIEATYYLMPRTWGLYQSVTRGERDKREATVRTLEREELQKVPGSLGDPIRVLQNMPGVARLPYVGGQIVVRGAMPEETGSYFDSVEIPLLFHFLGGPSVVNPEFLDRLDFYPGGFGPRYGRAIGGIVDAHTRRGSSEAMHGSFKVDLIDSAAFFEAPVGESTTLAIAARRSYVDLILPAVIPEDPRTGTVSVLPRYWDYQVRADHGGPADRHSFSVMAFGSDDQLAVALTGGQRDRSFSLDARTNFHRARASWTYRNGAITNVLSPYAGRDALFIGAAEGTGSLSGETVAPVGGVRDELKWELGGGDVLRLGADFQLAQTRFEATVPSIDRYRSFPGADPLEPSRTIERRIDDFDFGLYSELELKALDALTFYPGLRFDRFRLHGRDRTSADPRLTVKLRVGEKNTFKGALGHYSMTPEPAQFDPEYGNPELGLQKALQTALGFERKLTDAVSVDLTGFYTRRYDLAVGSSKVTVGDDGALHPERYNNDGLGRSYGLELMVRHEITERFFGWLAYTLSRTEERRRNEHPYRLSTFDEPHILTAVAQYKLGRGWELGGRFRLVSGRPATPVEGATFDADTWRYRSIRGEAGSTRLPYFDQLDLRVDKSWLFEQWKLGVYLDVQNVFWSDNIEGVQYDYRYREQTFIPGLPILPTVGVKGSF